MSIAIDLDGTLAHYEKFEGEESIGKIIPVMKKRILDWKKTGKKIVIFTARAGTAKGKKATERWLSDNGLEGLEVTNVKDYTMSHFFDDRAIRVEKNTGKLLNKI
jgi:hypothetical protein